jgi:hypothetical protein
MPVVIIIIVIIMALWLADIIRIQRKHTELKKYSILAQNSINEVIFSSFVQFHLPFAKLTVVSHHDWIPLPLIGMLRYTCILMESFTLFITSGTRTVRRKVQMLV